MGFNSTVSIIKCLFSTDSSLDCSIENDEANFLLQQSTSQQHGYQSQVASNNLDKPFGMDLSVEFGGHSNRSSVASQVRCFMIHQILSSYQKSCFLEQSFSVKMIRLFLKRMSEIDKDPSD